MTEVENMPVADLKQALTKRKLSTDGFKKDLIDRLVASGYTGKEEEETKEETKNETAAEEPSTTEKDVADAAAAPVETSEITETKEAEPVLTKEELKTKAIELINTKIKRATKFNELDEVAKLEKDLKRIEKFGVDPSTSVARELGIYKQDNSGSKKPFHKNNNNRNNKQKNGSINNNRNKVSK